ncbi:MAG: hypothetical protein NVSMB65_05500 [Chloroflexota bacterium]
MARWERATRLLRLPPGSPVLDVGCAFGYGTARLARRYQAEGIDPSPAYIARARRRYPRIPFTLGEAAALPYPNDRYDGAVMLDVLEHLPAGTEQHALAQIARVLRPGGVLVLSTPNHGILAWADALNLYLRVYGADPALVETFALRGTPPRHRHYSARDLCSLLRSAGLTPERVHYSGLGVAELINIVLLMLLWPFRLLRPLYTPLQYLYYGAYMAEDACRLGPCSYHVMVVARKG